MKKPADVNTLLDKDIKYGSRYNLTRLHYFDLEKNGYIDSLWRIVFREHVDFRYMQYAMPHNLSVGY